jgi:hypothetical protein
MNMRKLKLRVRSWKLALGALLLSSLFPLPISASAGNIFPVTNETDVTFSSASYDTTPYILWGAYLKTYFDAMYPQFTNHWWSWSRSGSSFQLDYQAQQQKWCAPLWSKFAVPSFDFTLVSENGGFDSNGIVQWETNIFNAPQLMYDGTSITNEGFSFPVTHYCIDGIPDDYSGSANLLISGAGLFISQLYGTTPIDLWHLVWTNGMSTDTNQLFGFYAGGHPYPAGHLAMALWTLLSLGAETNIGSITINFGGGSIAATNHMTASGVSMSGNTFSCTLLCDRMPPAWDVPDGTITNDARNCFVIYPMLAGRFHWSIHATNLPAGNDSVSLGGTICAVLTDTQLAAGWNMFTNYTGPFWQQRTKLLADARDSYGVDHATLLPAHTAGDPGLLGPDLIDYQSESGLEYDTNGKRGATYTAAMLTWVNDLYVYDTATHNDAQPVARTLVLQQIVPRWAPFHR